MKYIDDIRDWLIANNLVAGYKVQPYEWKDSAITTDRFIVIQPDGGQPARRARPQRRDRQLRH